MNVIAREQKAARGNVLTRTLRMLPAPMLGLLLYVYAWMGLGREIHPVVVSVQVAALLLLSGWWVWKVIRRDRIIRSPLSLPLLAVVGAAALSTLFSIDPRISLVGLLSSVTLVLLFFAVCDLVSSRRGVEMLIDALLLLGTYILLHSLWVTLQWHWGWWEFRVPGYPLLPVPFRLFGVSLSPNSLAGLVNLILPFAILRLSRARTKGEAVVYASWLLAAVAVLFFTQSRGGWIASAAAVSVAVGWLGLRSLSSLRPSAVMGCLRSNWRPWAVTAAYLGLFLALMMASRTMSPSTFNTNETVSTTNPAAALEHPTSRISIWMIAWNDFLSHPLVGSGPSTYAQAFQSETASHWRITSAPHAHNLVLNTLAEQGIIGLLALAWVLGTVALVLYRGIRGTTGRRETDERQRVLMVGSGAALAGWFVHSQVDVLGWLPVTSVVVVILLGIAMYSAGALERDGRGLSRWAALILVIPLLLSMFLAQQWSAQEVQVQAVRLATDGDWAAAAERLEEAVSADPHLTLYHEQLGFAYGVLAAPASGEGSEVALWAALESYAVAQRDGPVRVPNLVNRAALLARLGEMEEADRLLERALPQGRGSPIPALMLAERYVERGDAGAARELLSALLADNPGVRLLAGCQVSELCREVAEAVPVRSEGLAAVHAEAEGFLDEGRPLEALEAIDRVPISSWNGTMWLDRARAHIALGQTAEAAYALRVVDEMWAGGSTRAALTRAELYVARGQIEDAVVALERVAKPRLSEQNYAMATYGRLSLPGALLPRIEILGRTHDDLEVYRRLESLYSMLGRTADANWAAEQAQMLSRYFVDSQ